MTKGLELMLATPLSLYPFLLFIEEKARGPTITKLMEESLKLFLWEVLLRQRHRNSLSTVGIGCKEALRLINAWRWLERSWFYSIAEEEGGASEQPLLASLSNCDE